jgi:hypothetical protein
VDSKVIHLAASRNLAKLLDPTGDSPTIYHGANPATVLRHQLAAPLADELSSPICGAEGRAEPLVGLDPSLETFDDLFHHANPPLDLLKRTKNFAKSCRANPDLLPPEVSTVIYYAALVLARQHHGVSITELPDELLEQGIKWALAQSWLDERTKSIFRRGIERVS